jgi:DNA-binding NarL/FixJ family response regulator
MTDRDAIVGRHEERRRLAAALQSAAQGAGSLVLVGGEAGVGKTRLADDLAATSGALVLRGAASHGGAAPYGPIVGALRAHLRAAPDAFAGCGALVAHLALLLPELGEPAAATDRATLVEAIRCALAAAPSDRPVLLFLDDLHWSDEATLELLAQLPEALRELPVLALGAYRSDGLPRDHGVRRLRNELRRAGQLDELLLDPFDPELTGQLLEALLGEPVSPALVRAVHDRTLGVPFFVEELGRALRVAGALRAGRRGLELADDGYVPLPETIRDAVLIGTSELSAAGRAATEAAAVAGDSFDLELVGAVTDEEGLAELAATGLIAEDELGRARFRHALAREALYADIPWLRRRTLHRRLAEALERAGGSSQELATHWIGARDSAAARAALLRAAAESQARHAFRDAAQAGRQALELWPEDEPDGAAPRIEAVERYARCSELAGDLNEAARAWREVSDVRGGLGEARLRAEAQRRLAAVLDLKGDPQAAFAARAVAADAFAAAGCHDEAALDHLAMANHLRLTGKHVAAAEVARSAGDEARQAGRADLALRAQGMEGMTVAKAGEHERGLELVRAGLAAALDDDLTAVAAELYQRLSLVLYDAADYPRAEVALDTALDLCQDAGDEAITSACVSCLAYVLRDRGEWPRAAEICRGVIAGGGNGGWVAQGLLGSVHGFQGRISSARRLLSSCLAVASKVGHYNMTIDSTHALAVVAATAGDDDEAAEHSRALLARWERSDDHHYALSGLRWAVAFFARRGDRASAHACTDAVARIASATGHAEALAALGHAIAETALADGDADTAAEQLARAVELHRTLDMPFVRAQIELRCGVAFAAAGEHDAGVERLCDAYRTARKLGARPLAAEAAGEVAALGESVVRRLGARAADITDNGGLSRRELEVVRLLAVGRTNREISQHLFLSPRTVDMHVRNILRKLDCRSRVEAAHRAGEKGLLV